MPKRDGRVHRKTNQQRENVPSAILPAAAVRMSERLVHLQVRCGLVRKRKDKSGKAELCTKRSELHRKNKWPSNVEVVTHRPEARAQRHGSQSPPGIDEGRPLCDQCMSMPAPRTKTHCHERRFWEWSGSDPLLSHTLLLFGEEEGGGEGGRRAGEEGSEFEQLKRVVRFGEGREGRGREEGRSDKISRSTKSHEVLVQRT